MANKQVSIKSLQYKIYNLSRENALLKNEVDKLTDDLATLYLSVSFLEEDLRKKILCYGKKDC